MCTLRVFLLRVRTVRAVHPDAHSCVSRAECYRRFVFALDGTVRAQKKRARLFAAGPIRKHRRDASDALLMMRLASAAGVVPSPALSHATMRLAAATGNRAVALGVLGVQAHHSTRLSKDTAVEFMRTHMPQYTVDGQGALRHQPGKRTVRRAWLVAQASSLADVVAVVLWCVGLHRWTYSCQYWRLSPALAFARRCAC